ncbi:hypothetical protein [Azospirillum canadense]|uniref:hypothetical protein n=1 Tax=Azospirillum canadense TaxID=403962 RepID=UPI00222743B2|nr:hypothetical protein [Azospirillum canadense]MCW2242252.1 hypothetical protein [Azospirillum canadense]
MPTFESRLEAAQARGLSPILAKPRVRITAAMQRGLEPLPSAAPTTPAAPEAASEPLSTRERIAYDDRIRDLERQLRQVLRDDLDAEKVRTAILGLTAGTPVPPAWLVEETHGGSAPGVPVTIWSDWHFGEVVRPVEVGGVNEFNITVARERVRRLVERTIDLCFAHMVRPEYPGIVVCLGGDMISGDIHEELAVSNELLTAPTLIELQGVLIWALERLADRFGRVFVPCVVGNHGRMTHKPRAKGRVHTSFEWLLYCQLERHFANDPRVQFHIPGEADAHFSVYGHRYMLTHGDSMGVKGGDGMIGLLGPVTRGTIKLRNSEAQIGRDFDTVILGHWHQYLPMPGCIVNGSLKGYDEYARLYLRARYQEPIQALWFTHAQRGVTFQVPVYLDERKNAEGRDWVAWRVAA